MYAQAIAYRAVKINTAILAALFVTFLLFYFMQFLIATNNASTAPLIVTRMIDNTVPVFENEIFEAIDPPTSLEEITPPEIDAPVREESAAPGVAFNTPWTPPSAPAIGVGNIPLSSNVMIPLIRTTANYPSRALANGIEGYVELSFTVNEFGNVQDPVVLYAEPDGYFERAALRSIERWRYAAAVENGEPVPTHDVRQRIVFQIDPSTR